MTVLKRIITAIKVKRHFKKECHRSCLMCKYLQLCTTEIEDAEIINDMLSKGEFNTEYDMPVKEE